MFGRVQPRHPTASSSRSISSMSSAARSSTCSVGHSRIRASAVTEGAAPASSTAAPRATAALIAASARRIARSIASCLRASQ